MIRIHASLHKCLTVYYMRVVGTLYNRFRWGLPRYQHYAGQQAEFYANLGRHRIISANGFAVDITRLPESFRIVRFVRDPRDLIVSGYLYHRQGAEPWFRRPSPTEDDWAPINGHVPEAMPGGISYAEYLGGLSVEDGLLAEMEFRKHHFESLRRWPADPRIHVFKYEDVLGNEPDVFGRIFEFYELPWHERRAVMWLARYYAARNRGRDRRIRDPTPGQWRRYFTPVVAQAFERQYGDLLELLEYET